MTRASPRVLNRSRLTRLRLNRWRERIPRNPMARKTFVSDWPNRFRRSAEDKMKNVVILAVLFGILSPVSHAQDKPKQDDKPKAEVLATTPVKVQIVFTEFENEKKVKSLPYTMYLNAPNAPEVRPPWVTMGIGSQLAVYNGQDQFPY